MYIVTPDRLLSHEMAMLHCHVEALLHEVLLSFDVSSRTQLLISAARLNVAVLVASLLEASLLRLEDGQVSFHLLASRLLECTRSNLTLCTGLVLGLRRHSDFLVSFRGVVAWSGNTELQAVAIEDLVEVESRAVLIEANRLAREDFVVVGPGLGSPLRSGVLQLILHDIFSRDDVALGLEDISCLVRVEALDLKGLVWCMLEPVGV